MFRLYGTGPGNGVLEVQSRYFERTISVSPIAGHPPRILHETPPTPFNTSLFYLSIRQLQDPLFHIKQFLSSLNIRPAACDVMAQQIAFYINQMCNGNRERNFHIIAEIDFIRVIWWLEDQSIGGGMVEETVVLDEARPRSRGVAEERLRKLKSEEKGKELGDCSICLDELSCECEKMEVIKIPCGHVYHESCIFRWLTNHNSCRLCRKPLPLEDST